MCVFVITSIPLLFSINVCAILSVTLVTAYLYIYRPRRRVCQLLLRVCSILTLLPDTTVEVTRAQMFQLQLCDFCTVPDKTFHFGNAGILASRC